MADEVPESNAASTGAVCGGGCRAPEAWAWLLSLPPLLCVGWLIVVHGVNAPYLDDWANVPLMEKASLGQLTVHDLWAQHNEHRILFPNLITLVFARLTAWNIHWELAFNFLVAAGGFAIVAGQVLSTARALGVAGLRWIIPAISLIMFSICQYECWLWSTELQVFLCMTAVLGGIVLLSRRPFAWHKLGLAALLGMVASYSFASGMTFWPVGLTVLLADPSVRRKPVAIMVWAGLGLAATVAYLNGWQELKEHPAAYPLEYVLYVLEFLGGAVGALDRPNPDGMPFEFGAMIGGAGLLAVAAWASWILVRRRGVRLEGIVPWLAFGAQAVGAAMLAGIARVGMGLEQPMSSRYCTLAAPLWVGVTVLLALVILTPGGTGDRNSRSIARWLLGISICVSIVAQVTAFPRAMFFSYVMAVGRETLLQLPTQAGADARGYYARIRATESDHPEEVITNYLFLAGHRLSCFGDGAAGR
jgi:hypothetical protein